jgi:hypothetical protein
VRLRHQLYEPVLHEIGILVFIHHDILEFILVVSQDVVVLFKELHRPKDQIVEVHGVVLFQHGLISSVELVNDFAFKVEPVDLGIL